MSKVNVYDFYITPEEYQVAEKNGISRQLLDIRVRGLAWDKEKAISTLPHEKNPIKDWVEIAEMNGICYSTLRYRMNRLKWNPERAATQPLQDKKKQAKKASESSRKYPEKYHRLAERNGINERTFHRRMKDGWAPETAATRPPMTPSEIGLLTKEKRKWELPFRLMKAVGSTK
jgi:hypothetical protein